MLLEPLPIPLLRYMFTLYPNRHMRRIGKSVTGEQRYACKCGATTGDNGKPRGRRPLGDRALTQKEKTARYKNKTLQNTR